LVILTPTLCVTFALATGFWVWAVTSFAIARWVYERFSQGSGETQKLQPYHASNASNGNGTKVEDIADEKTQLSGKDC